MIRPRLRYTTCFRPRTLSSCVTFTTCTPRHLPRKSHWLDQNAVQRHRVNEVSISKRSFQTTHLRSTVSPFKLHDIGEGITEVEIIRWYVEEGQEVVEFDPLCEVQSDKSVVELTSHANGLVRGLQYSAGETVKVGQTLCDIHTSEDGDGDSTDPLKIEEMVVSPQTDLDSSRSQSTREIAVEDKGIGINEPEQKALEENKVQHVDQAERLNEQLEKLQDQAFTSSSPSPTSREHRLAEEESNDPIQLQGEASILPSPPTSFAQTYEAVPPRKENIGNGIGIGIGIGNENEKKGIVRASPAIRTLASKLGVELNSVKGTGENGRITKDDVLAISQSQSQPQPHLQNSQSRLDRYRQVGSGHEHEHDQRDKDRDRDRDDIQPYTKVNLGRTRKAMWKGLSPQGSIPHFGYSHTIDLTFLLPYMKVNSSSSSSLSSNSKRNSYIASDIPQQLVRNPLDDNTSWIPSKHKNTLLSFFVKGLVLALEEHPIMRSRVKENQDDENERWLEVARDPIIGIAVSDPKYGLLTPSLPPLHPSTSLSTISSHLSALRNSPSKPTPPGNITVSSIGGLGEGLGAMPIIPPGGGIAICAIGRAAWRMEWDHQDGNKDCGKSVWELSEEQVVKGGMTARLKVNVGWSGDHRILEGAELIAFTETWKKYIEEPWRWINIS
ncbi:uncharacterized protein IL334_000129 [Kwoniella shivajii]|uniref:Dihydrolipoamide acetyltransferase component of pyruvate dehydrogenase complex n=1 Tax=Kwoniella shivajii TaxID=564305 RepID=A0ABZ1CNM2_9TREE|nr:hypothetical protein IL334_000129 [Kwoniella shivajii]